MPPKPSSTETRCHQQQTKESIKPLLPPFRVFIDPATKTESTELPRSATVIDGPKLQQEPNESAEIFESIGYRDQLRKRNE